ncbi:12930_t:CDS:1, partial [Dentiscutata erythropus]
VKDESKAFRKSTEIDEAIECGRISEIRIERDEVLDTANSPQTEEMSCTSRPKNKKNPWSEMFVGRMTIIGTIKCKTA